MKPSYILFLKRSYKELILIVLIGLTFIGYFIFFKTLNRLMNKVTDDNRDFITKIETPYYTKISNGYEKVYKYVDIGWSYLAMTIMVFMIPTVIWLIYVGMLLLK